MALNPSTNPTMSGRITAPDAEYPYGSSKDETLPGVGDGMPYFKARADDILGMQQALLSLASIVPSGDADNVLASDYMSALVELASGRAFNYDDSGAPDVYVLEVKAKQYPIAGYFDGLQVVFLPANTNTGASTVDVSGLGGVNIKLKGGLLDPPAGDIVTTAESSLIYRLSPTPHFELVSSASGAASVKVGALMDFAGLVPPPEYLICDASELDEVLFADLFAAIGHTWDTTGGVAVPAAGNFRLPPSSIGGLGLFRRGVGAVPVGTYEGDVFKEHSHLYDRNQGGGAGSQTGTGAGNISIPTGLTGDIAETRPRAITTLVLIKF